jgi:hypothetical protein
VAAGFEGPDGLDVAEVWPWGFLPPAPAAAGSSKVASWAQCYKTFLSVND